MPRIQYMDFNFKASSKRIIAQALEIIGQYDFALTLRQLYYQFVQKDLIPNTQKSYKSLGGVINDARLAGLIDWNSIEDLTRDLRGNPHWHSPAQFMESVVPQYANDLWADQQNHVEVWVEKDALRSIVGRVCKPEDVGYFSCRGYGSQSEMWAAGMRFKQKMNDSWQGHGERFGHIIHLGDHDPSGLDMTRDITERMEMFLGPEDFERRTVHRIALNMDQIRRFKPPPNPAKVTDSRAKKYIAEFGTKSWELDALPPKELDRIIRHKIRSLRDDDIWEASIERQNKGRAALEKAQKAMPKE